jgi:hypothetical protein
MNSSSMPETLIDLFLTDPPSYPLDLTDPLLLFVAVHGGTGNIMLDAQIIKASQDIGYTGPTHA